MKQFQELLVSSAVMNVPNLRYQICVVTDSSVVQLALQYIKLLVAK
jgi:hypothetical protein